jgi:hypothetical protein
MDAARLFVPWVIHLFAGDNVRLDKECEAIETVRVHRAILFVLLCGLLSACGLPKDFYSSKSPDGKRSISVRAHYIFPDYSVWFTVSEGWRTTKIHTAPGDRMPTYAEALWLTNSTVAILECDAVGPLEVVGYDFDSGKTVNSAARAEMKVYIVAKHNPTSEMLAAWQNDPLTWYCDVRRK